MNCLESLKGKVTLTTAAPEDMSTISKEPNIMDFIRRTLIFGI